jgi:hypothetical protein
MARPALRRPDQAAEELKALIDAKLAGIASER